MSINDISYLVMTVLLVFSAIIIHRSRLLKTPFHHLRYDIVKPAGYPDTARFIYHSGLEKSFTKTALYHIVMKGEK